MATFLDGKQTIMDIILTQKGREQLAKGKLKIKYYAFGDDEIDYAAQYTNRASGSVWYYFEQSFIDSYLPLGELYKWRNPGNFKAIKATQFGSPVLRSVALEAQF